MGEKNYSKSKVFSLVVALVGLLITLAIVLGGAALAGHVWDPKWNPFGSSTESRN